MKLAFIVHNEYFTPRVMKLLQDAGIDYYTRWDRAQGKGSGTEPHLGWGGFASTNAVLMIAPVVFSASRSSACGVDSQSISATSRPRSVRTTTCCPRV